MTSLKKTQSNRLNALKSTGPRSLSGKSRSSQNAVKHGLTAMQTMLPGEKPEEFQGLREAMFKSLNPQGALENQLVERAIMLTWRLRRVPQFENALFRWTIYAERTQYDTDKLDELDQKNDPAHEQEVDSEFEDGLTLGRMFETLLATDMLGKMGRYETTMHNQLMQILEQLRLNKSSNENIARIVKREVDQATLSEEEKMERRFGRRVS